MTQQVNLYQPILRREKKVFSALTMLQALAAIAALMLLLYVFSYWQLQQLETENAQLLEQQAALAERVAELSRNLQARPESRELRRELQATEREAELKQQLAQLIGERQMPATAGFAEAVAGLARQRIDGLWLTGIRLHNAGGARQVALRGMAARAELVPQLVQRLGDEAAFQGTSFRHMRVFRPEDDQRRALAFELSTEAPEETTP